MDFTIALGLVGAIAMALAMLYRRLLALRQARNRAFDETGQWRRRRQEALADLIGTAQSAMSDEQALLTAVEAARQAAQGANGIAAALGAEAALDRACAMLWAALERHPEVKDSANSRERQAKLIEIERNIAVTRRMFNQATAEYNDAIARFPASLLARLLGLRREAEFDLSQEHLV